MNARRRPNLASVLLAAIAVSLALITLFSLEPPAFLPEGFRVGAINLGQILIQIVTVVGALAVIVGSLNLLVVHVGKIRRPTGGSAVYSIIMILTFFAVLIAHILERLGVLKVANSATDAPLITLRLMDAIQVSIESALSGLLFFFLVYAAFRLLRRRVTVWGVLFIAALTLVLVAYRQPPDTFLASVRDWLLSVPVGAGTRGLLIGIAIGTVTVGARVLIGQDRIFRE
jgi:hypothetical protein